MNLFLYTVLEDVSMWTIEFVNEKQVFDKPGYGFKLVVPPSSVEKGQEIKTEVNIISPEKFELPDDIELVSCIYMIETTGEFFEPVEVYLQHNVELETLEECKQLTFITADGPPPYKFHQLPNDTDQQFRPYDNTGVLKVSHFCSVAVAIKRGWEMLKDGLFRKKPKPLCSYLITVFLKQVKMSCWEIQTVVTKNLPPFLKVGTDRVLTLKSDT